MSLRVWLPLNGSLENKGLDDAVATLSGAVAVDNNGKIGKCYKFGTATGRITLPASTMTSFSECSVTFWVNILGWQTNWDTFFQAGLGNRAWTQYTFGILRNTGNRLVFCISNNSTASQGNYYTSDLTLETWYHLGFTYKAGHCCVYVNGELFKDYETTIIPKFSGITHVSIGQLGNEASYQTNCKMNDFRIYDHALSPMEVKQISQGLVLHYPLNDKYIENTINLITTEDCLSSTCYNASTKKYSYGTSTDMYKEVTTFEGRKGTKVHMGTDGNNCFPYVYVNNMYTSDGTNSPAYKTLSFDYYTTVSTSITSYKLGSGTGTAAYIVKNKNGTKTGIGTDTVTIPVLSDVWNHIEITFHGTSATDSQWGYIQNNPAHISDTSNFWFFANMQLEAKDHATGYTKYGITRNNNIIYDTSGYNNNGTAMGNLECSSDTPRYDVSTHFGATTSKIRIDNLITTGFSNSYTFSWWGKYTTLGNSMFWGFQNGVRLNGVYHGIYWNTSDGNSNPIYKPGTTTVVTAPEANVWHHYVMTGDNTVCKLYVDGELYGQAKTHKTISGNIIYINGWDSGTGYSFTDMDMSDFRIYCTTLSPEDVLDLYNLGAAIDTNNNLYTYEVTE